MKALLLVTALMMTGASIANASQVRQVADIKQSDDPNSNESAKIADRIANGPSCPLINGSSASRDANTTAETAKTATSDATAAMH